jgi:DNA-binding MarR family transcriptional regulator
VAPLRTLERSDPGRPRDIQESRTSMRNEAGGRRLAKADFEAISELRYQIRRFLRFSEHAVRHGGLTPLQYLLLLHLRGFPGRDWATIAELAERLQAKHHGVVALVLRCERLGLVSKRPGRLDRRRVEVSLAPKGARMLGRLVRLHRAELRALRRAFAIAEISAYNEDRRGTTSGARPRRRRRPVRALTKRPQGR